MAANCSGRIFRRILIGLGAAVILLILSSYLFIHFYFQRTFSHQVTGVVIRCSDGIFKMSAAESSRLKVGDQIAAGMKIQTPEARRSMLSFSGMRLLTNGSAKIHINNSRGFTLESGRLTLQTSDKGDPCVAQVGSAEITTSNSVVLLAADPAAVVCIAGHVSLLMNKTETLLEAGRKITCDAQAVATTFQGENPFAGLKPSTMERTRQRFERVIERYARSVGGNERQALLDGRNGGGLRFVSYFMPASLRLAQRDAAAVAEYYDALFVPSNRSISIGKQKAVPLTPYFGSSWPLWSHDGSMIAYIEAGVYSYKARVRVARVADLDNPWDISQGHDDVLPFFPIAWAPDDRHVLFMVPDSINPDLNARILWQGPYHIMIAPIDPTEGALRKFESPFTDLPISLPLPIGKTISPVVMDLPWGDAMLCANWGNLAYIPIEPDGLAVAGAPGIFITNFSARECFVAGGMWAPSGSKILFAAAENLNFDSGDVFILNEVEDILDGLAPPPRSLDDPRIKRVAQSKNIQLPGSFSYDESLVFYQEDVNGAWRALLPSLLLNSDFDLFYADARPGQPSKFTQIHLPGNQMFLGLSPEGNRLVYTYANHPHYELRVVSFDIEADMDMELGGVLIDNSGTNLIVPPGTLEENFKVKISTPFTIPDEAILAEGESPLFAMRMLDAEGLEKPKFIEPMTLTIRYTDEEVAGLDEGMLEIYYYDESDPANPVWVPLGGSVDPENNEITIEVQHFSSFSVGPGKKK